MLKALKDLGTRLGRRAEPSYPDPAVFNDPCAMSTSWQPLKGGGANFRTRKLVVVDPDRVEVRSTAGALLFCLVFISMGLLASGLCVSSLAGGSSIEPDAGLWLPGTVGVVFISGGFYMLRAFTAPVVFDARNEYFWKGRRSPVHAVNRSALKYFTEFTDIHALQLIAEYCRSDKSSYYSYELNLVLKSGDRINVFDHGNLKRAREDAEKLARFLKCPVWDAT